MESDSSEEQNEAIVTKIMKLKYDLTYDAFREVTFQEHKTEKPCPEKPLKRTLFLSKVPPWANESGLQRIFECNGPVQKVFLAKKASSGLTDEDSRDYSGVDRFLFPTKDTSGFKFAYVVYEKPSSVTKALNTMDLSHPYILSDEENPIVTGNFYYKYILHFFDLYVLIGGWRLVMKSFKLRGNYLFRHFELY